MGLTPKQIIYLMEKLEYDVEELGFDEGWIGFGSHTQVNHISTHSSHTKGLDLTNHIFSRQLDFFHNNFLIN